jgi:hypothetical protein
MKNIEVILKSYLDNAFEREVRKLAIIIPISLKRNGNAGDGVFCISKA